MSGTASVLLVGFLFGMQHATEADHLAAVATLATRNSTAAQALRQGLAWGTGHTVTLFMIGGSVLALGKALPPHFETVLEMAVGVMLMLLGADVLRRLRGEALHFHVHRHGPGEAAHVHAHGHQSGHAPEHRPAVAAAFPGPAGGNAVQDFSSLQFAAAGAAPHADVPHRHPASGRLPLRAMMIGMMHGMAGSAALIVLSLQTVSSVATGLLYILIFGIGSIVGMAALSVAIALPLRISAGSITALHRGLTALIGLFSLGLGAWTIYRLSTAL